VWKKIRRYQLRWAAHVVIAGFFCAEGKQEALDCWNNRQKTILLLFTEIDWSTLDSCSNRMWFRYVARTGDHPLQEYLARKKPKKKKRKSGYNWVMKSFLNDSHPFRNYCLPYWKLFTKVWQINKYIYVLNLANSGLFKST